MSDSLGDLYQRMVSHFFEWSNTPIPKSNSKTEDLWSDTDELDRVGLFRSREWVKYCDARDKFIAARKFMEAEASKWKN